MTEKEIQELARDFNNRREYIVPVIGEDLLCYVEDAQQSEKYAPDGSISLQQYLVDHLFVEKDPSMLSESERALKERMKEADWYYCLTLLGKKDDRFETKYINILRDPHVKLSYETGSFLEQNNFHLILTTLTTDIIERTVGDKQYNSIWYNLDWKANTSCSLEQPTVFHLMGNSNAFRFVKNENDLVEFLDKLLSIDHGPDGIFTQLTDKALMMLGCELPDWVFRLLLYRMDKNGFDGKKLGFWLEGPNTISNPQNDDNVIIKEMSSSQMDFLDQIRFQHLSDLKRILPLLTPGSDFNGNIRQHGYEYDIFLSYAGEDVGYKNAVARELKRQCPQLNIWAAPERTKQGGDYWIHIQEGIKKSRYFMPLISTGYLDKMLNPDPEYGKWLKEETNEAVAELERRNKNNKEKGKSPVMVYSLPVFDPRGKFYDTSVRHLCSITNTMIEKFANEEEHLLPPCMFLQKHMYDFQENDADCTFCTNEWGRYKEEIE